MLKAAIVSTVDFCTKFAYVTIALALLIAGFTVYYTGGHFAINTDITKVFSNDIPWTQRENEFDKPGFPKAPTKAGAVQPVQDRPG
jgi:hypothetical protein